MSLHFKIEFLNQFYIWRQLGDSIYKIAGLDTLKQNVFFFFLTTSVTIKPTQPTPLYYCSKWLLNFDLIQTVWAENKRRKNENQRLRKKQKYLHHGNKSPLSSAYCELPETLRCKFIFGLKSQRKTTSTYKLHC